MSTEAMDVPCPGNNCGDPIIVKFTYFVEGEKSVIEHVSIPASCPSCKTTFDLAMDEEIDRYVRENWRDVLKAKYNREGDVRVR